jgi:hypothetical protein
MLFQQLVNTQQDVFALLVLSLLTSCQWLVDNLLQDCWAQQTCCKLFQQLVIVLQFNNLSTSYEWQPCSNLIKYQHCYTLLTSLPQVCCEHILLSCEIFTCVIYFSKLLLNERVQHIIVFAVLIDLFRDCLFCQPRAILQPVQRNINPVFRENMFNSNA